MILRLLQEILNRPAVERFRLFRSRHQRDHITNRVSPSAARARRHWRETSPVSIPTEYGTSMCSTAALVRDRLPEAGDWISCGPTRRSRERSLPLTELAFAMRASFCRAGILQNRYP